jgi:PAS domain S-box-containing protein
LHVDDDPVLQEIMKLMLQDLEGSIEIDNASSVDEGLAKLAAKTYDLVVSDYDMPMKNGLDFLQQIRQNKNLTPFILFTGKGREEVAIRALNLGADGYYNKQGTPETVYGELAHGITLVTEKAKANSALEASEKRYHTLMDNAAEAIFIHDIKGKILDVNEQACKNLQYTKEELLSKSIKDISVTAENDKRLNEIWSKVLTGNTISLQSTQIRKDKSRFPVEVTLSIISFDKEKLVIALVKDITERKKAEDYLKFSKEFSESIINSVDEMLLVIDVNDFKIVDGNVAALKQTGCSKAELIGKTCFAMTHHSSFHCQAPNDICPIHEMLETGTPVKVEHKHFDKNNNELFVEVSVYPIRNVEGKIIQATHISRDITETKKDNAISKSTCNELNSLFLAMNEGFCLHELVYNEFGKAVDYTILEVNPAYELILGLKKNEVIGRRGSDVYGSNEAPYLEEYAKVAETKEPVIFETYFAPLKKNFSISIFSPNKDQFATVFTDITERKKAEENIRVSKQRLKDAQRVAHIGTWDLAVETGVLLWDEETYKVFGFLTDIVPSVEKFLERIHPDDLAFVKQSIEGGLKGNPYDIDMRIIRMDGALRVANATGKAEFDDEGKPVRFFGMIQDITERKNVEEKLKNLKAFDERIINSLGDALLVIDPDNYKIITVNEAALKQIKMKKDDVIGKTCHEMTHHSSIPCQPPNDICPIQAVIETGNPVTVEHVHLDENNNPRIVEVWARPVINPEGKNVIIHVAKDITEHKEAEERLELMMDQLVLVNEKLGVVGSMTRHDVRNKLSTVTGYAYLLKKKHSDQADIVEGLGKMEQAVKESMKIF